MKVTKPYELLVRYAPDGSVSGAHVKAQSYYTREDGSPDLDTWREEQPTPAVLGSPEVSALVEACRLSLAAQVQQLQAELATVTAERDELAEAVQNANAEAGG